MEDNVYTKTKYGLYKLYIKRDGVIMERKEPKKIDGKDFDANQVHRLCLHLVMLTKCHGWIQAHDKMERNYTLGFVNRLWQLGFEKGYFYRAADGRVLLTEHGAKKW